MHSKWILLSISLLSTLAETQRARVVANLGNMAKTKTNTTRNCALAAMKLPDCSTSKYQHIDGSCNNLINPLAGAARTPFKRLLPPLYGDGKATFRQSRAGGKLPAARTLSNELNDDRVVKSTSMSAMHVQFGQYITHDFAHALPKKKENGVAVNCTCDSPSKSCINVPVAALDNHYGPAATCIPLEGSLTVEGCDDLPREQINSLTSFIDATTVYGRDREMLDALRDKNSDSGELLLIGGQSGGCPFRKNTVSLPARENVPANIAKRISCLAHLNPPGSTCFVAGDVRVNENVGLAATHLIFVREHNRLARRLKVLNPQWDSDTVFNEARRINIAIHQIITYREYLPPLIGAKLMKQAGLKLLKNGFYYGYDASVDATIFNEFTTAALRYGHSQVPDHFSRPGPDYVTQEAPDLPMFKTLFQQEAMVNKSSAALFRGLTSDPAFGVDHRFVTDLRNRMFESSTKLGQDLFAINIQRGREHGLPTYNQFREFCGLPRAVDWNEYSDYINVSTVHKIQAVYRHVDDVDLYVGGLAENPVEGGALGPTFACLFAYQFRDLRKGDRFWFENPGQFSADQLRELRKVKFSRLMCDNLEGMRTVSPNAMLQPEGFNARVPCSSLPEMDLSPWKLYDHRQDGEWTRWFVIGSPLTANSFLELRNHKERDVCTNPINSEIKKLPRGNEGSKKVRFLCPSGSNRMNTFASVSNNVQFYWTNWLDRDSPKFSNGDDVETHQFHLLERPDDVCVQPLYMQAQTKDRESALDSDEVFETFSASKGLTCRGRHQENSTCKDYRIRFYCPKAHKIDVERQVFLKLATASRRRVRYVWTPWINLSNPAFGNFDDERKQLAILRGFTICNKPIKIEARVVGSRVPVQRTSDVLQRFSRVHGLLCYNQDQSSGRCRDYEVRYLCP